MLISIPWVKLFWNQRYSQQSINCSTHQCKALGINKSVRGFLNMLYQEALHKCFLSCANSLITIGDRRWKKLAATFKKLDQQIHCCFHGNWGPSCGVPIFVWVLINECGCCNWNGWHSWGAYFLWVPILLILYSSHLMGSIPLKRLPLHTNTIKHLLHAGEVLRNNQVVWVVYSGTLHGRHPPATPKTVSHVLLFVYSGNPLNGHLSTADTHNITDNSQSPDSPSIHFKT